MKTKKPAARAKRRPAQKTTPTRRAARQIVRRKLPTHRRVLAHPATLFLLLCVGVSITNWTLSSNADTIAVSAKVPAAPLSSGAVISQPQQGAVLQSSPINVIGTCPANSYVKLLLNSTFRGSAWCAADQTFTIQTVLVPGTNVLQAQDYNITNDPGPATPTVSVTYAMPVPPLVPLAVVKNLQQRAGLKNVTSGQPSSQPLLLSSDFTYKSFALSEPFQWSFAIAGGTSPYVIQTDWGDSSTALQAVRTPSLFTISHIYKRAGYFPVWLHAVDAVGHQTNLQVAAFIRQPGGVGFGQTKAPTAQVPGQSFLQWLRPWLWLAWSSYGVVMLMALSFWLGERQEMLHLLHRRPAGRHR